MSGTGRSPWLSVVMPTYNGARFVGRALESVAAGSTEDLEVIAVDDGSTDGTLQVLASFSDRFPLTVIEQEHRGSWVASTNRGLGVARGRYVSFLHQDDLWMPSRMRVVRARLERVAPTFLIHPVWYVDPQDRRVGQWRCPLPASSDLDKALLGERLLVQNFVAVPGTVFPRETALQLGGLDEDLWYTADWDLWIRLAAAVPVAYLPRPLAAFRVHAGAQTATKSLDRAAFSEQMERVLERHARTLLPDGPDEDLLSVARFSIELNTLLAARFHGAREGTLGLVARFLGLGPTGWRRYVRDSRVIERVGSRIRAGMRGGGHGR